MLRRYRNIVFALVGWLSLTAQHPNPPAKPHQARPAQTVKDAARHIATPNYDLAERSHRAKYEAECDPGNEKRDSDLCAQWKAADAADRAAWWAKWGVWASTVSTLLVLLALGLAFQSNRIARDAATRQLRAYVSMNKMRLKRHPETDEYLLRVEIKNFGMTPASKVRVRFSTHAALPDEIPELSLEDLTFAPSQSTLAAGKISFQVLHFGREATDALGIFFQSSEDATLYVYGEIEYSDVFKRRHISRFRMSTCQMVLRNNPGRFAYCEDGNDEIDG